MKILTLLPIFIFILNVEGKSQIIDEPSNSTAPVHDNSQIKTRENNKKAMDAKKKEAAAKSMQDSINAANSRYAAALKEVEEANKKIAAENSANKEYFLCHNTSQYEKVQVSIKFESPNGTVSEYFQYTRNDILSYFDRRMEKLPSSEIKETNPVSLNCTIKINFSNATGTDGKGQTVNGYRCEISVSLISTGNQNISKHFTISDKTDISKNKDDAFYHVLGKVDLKANMLDFIWQNFPLKTIINSFDEKDKKKNVEIITINAGKNYGLFKPAYFGKFNFNIYTMNGDMQEKVGEAKIKEVDETTSKCKVTDGEEKITKLMDEGKKLFLVSNY